MTFTKKWSMFLWTMAAKEALGKETWPPFQFLGPTSSSSADSGPSIEIHYWGPLIQIQTGQNHYFRLYRRLAELHSSPIKKLIAN